MNLRDKGMDRRIRKETMSSDKAIHQMLLYAEEIGKRLLQWADRTRKNEGSLVRVFQES